MIKALAKGLQLLDENTTWFKVLLKIFLTIMIFIRKQVRCQGSQKKVRKPVSISGNVSDCTCKNSVHWQSRASVVDPLKLSHLDQISFLLAENISHISYEYLDD